MRPTMKHRPAIWENMLGTVYAMNDARECKYFDYDYEAALAFAGVSSDNSTGDNRLSKPVRRCSWIRKGCWSSEPRRGQLVLWVKK